MSKKYRCTPVDSKDLEDVIMLELKKEVKKLIKEETEKKEVVKEGTKSKAEYMKEYRKKKKEETGTETKKRGRPTRTEMTDKKEKMKKETDKKEVVKEEDKEEEDQVEEGEVNILKPPKSGYFETIYFIMRTGKINGLINRLEREYDTIKDNDKKEKQAEEVLILINKMKEVRKKINDVYKLVYKGEKVKYDYNLMKMSDIEKEVKKYFGEETKKDKERIKRDEKQILGEIKKKK